ncbi:hypothetical protein AYI70_g3179 [Smittium culicis]|uniref:Uncharacterized protein n=1 Tax=Smittium culicis TaxID=133412 RepID=A0A1R1Y542_9FUNG|nr:hypothetical protein AYI70_g3179 [Smittium culicis]
MPNIKKSENRKIENQKIRISKAEIKVQQFPKIENNSSSTTDLPKIPEIHSSLILAASDKKNNASIHMRLNQPGVALDYYKESIKVLETCPNHPYLALLKYNISSLYIKVEDYEKASSCLKDSISISKIYLGYGKIMLNVPTDGKLVMSQSKNNHDSYKDFRHDLVNGNQRGSSNNHFIESINHESKYSKGNYSCSSSRSNKLTFDISDIVVDVVGVYKKSCILRGNVNEKFLSNYLEAIFDYEKLLIEFPEDETKNLALLGISRCKQKIINSKKNLLKSGDEPHEKNNKNEFFKETQLVKIGTKKKKDIEYSTQRKNEESDHSNNIIEPRLYKDKKKVINLNDMTKFKKIEIEKNLKKQKGFVFSGKRDYERMFESWRNLKFRNT